MTGLSDAERDASDVMQALVGLAALLRRQGATAAARVGPDDPDLEDARRVMLSIAEDGEQAAARVVAYLNDQRGAGDGDLVAVPPRLGQWREWVPPRGHLFGVAAPVRRNDEVPQPRRADPGE
ncbi:MAG: hypothetical protein ABW046_16090 [Actinoplanes sp.]